MLQLVLRHKKLISLALVGASFIGFGQIVVSSYNELSDSISSIDIAKLLVAGVPALLYLYLSATTFYMCLKKNYASSMPGVSLLIVPYFVSQIVRYLPGKIWSLVYQASRMSDYVPVRNIVIANVESFFLVNLNTIFIAISVLLLFNHYFFYTGIIFLSAMFVSYYVQHLSLYKKVILKILASRISEDLEGILDSGQLKSNYSFIISLLLQFEWVAFFLVWYFILPSSYSLLDILAVSVAYAIAWQVGVLAFIIPAGIIVREAAFVWVAGFLFGFGQADLVIASITARFLFVLIDVVGVVSAFVITKFSSVIGS